MRKSPVPAARSSLGKPEVSSEDLRSPARPARPPRISGEPKRVSAEHNPQPSPRAPPRPPSLKSSNPPPRPPPPSKKGSEETMITFPGDSSSLNRSRPPSDRKSNPDYTPERPKLPPRSDPSRSSLRNATPYDPDLNPFGEEDDDNEDDQEDENDKSKDDSNSKDEPSLNPFGDDFDDEEDDDTNDDQPYENVKMKAPKTPPLPQRTSVNPFFTASVKKKAAPAPPSKGLTPSSPPSSVTPGQGHGVYANVDSTDGEMVTSDSQPSTSGAANEKPADLTDAPPITIVSFCL